jgi:hypothetical protein
LSFVHAHGDEPLKVSHIERLGKSTIMSTKKKSKKGGADSGKRFFYFHSFSVPQDSHLWFEFPITVIILIKNTHTTNTIRKQPIIQSIVQYPGILGADNEGGDVSNQDAGPQDTASRCILKS